jgi:hypothetical protein
VTWLGGIELIAIALLIPGCAGALIIAAILLIANDKTHRHCANPDEGWE